jgi:hypothetical protein
MNIPGEGVFREAWAIRSSVMRLLKERVAAVVARNRYPVGRRAGDHCKAGLSHMQPWRDVEPAAGTTDRCKEHQDLRPHPPEIKGMDHPVMVSFGLC